MSASWNKDMSGRGEILPGYANHRQNALGLQGAVLEQGCMEPSTHQSPIAFVRFWVGSETDQADFSARPLKAGINRKGTKRRPIQELFFETQRRFLGKSVGRDGEVDGNLCLGLDGVLALIMRLEMPLLHGLLRGAGKNWRTAEHMQILDQAIAADQRLQDH